MNEVTKKEFKKIYFKYGKAEEGWTREYWKKFYENPKIDNMRYMVRLPDSDQENRMMIVDDYSAREFRLFFLTVEKEEAFFENPGNNGDS